MSVNYPRKEVDLDIVRRGYVDTLLLPESIPPFAYTILYPHDTASQGPRVLCRCLRPRPRRCLPETTDLPDAQSKSTTQHSSTDPTLFYIPCSQNCPPSLNSPHSFRCCPLTAVGKTPAPTCVHDDPRACDPLALGPVKEDSLLRMEEARRPRVEKRGCRTVLV